VQQFSRVDAIVGEGAGMILASAAAFINYAPAPLQ